MSVPDLRRKRPIWLLIAIAVAVVVAAIVAVVVVGTGSVADPGKQACDHVEQQAEMGAARWDSYIDSLVETVESRMVNVADNNEPIRIRGSTRDDRCRETLRKLRKAMQPNGYTRLASCIADASTTRQASLCLALVR